ncbi:glycosyltransferase family 4 protein [Bradyrhizobium sp. Gha]|uniref:glycosyltransferase family 4 protein n=1 Tax=Bradyrhizobium sp. Gha TaxID=1855318 RepID=UPI0008EFA93F|nr:glycosyltransferase family 4 protein [Bradyrhizobium sp. Gha]SFI08702.1 Glycosyltransferase involved in cell wall bisynthesis [Bradyrhizobium sp. Gha]
MTDAADPTVNIAVCGDFKQLQLVPELNKVAHLQRVYYASRLSNDATKLQIRPSQARNLFLKEYLLQFHARYLNHAFADTIYPLYDRLWRASAHLAWQPCGVLHVVTQGKALGLVQRAKSEGSAILGHPIVCHPDFFEREMRLELDRLSLSPASFLADIAETRAEIGLCDRIYCLSGLVRDSFVAAGFPGESIDIIQLPTDLETFAPASERNEDGPFRVLCVAELNPIKGHVYLLEAWKALRLQNAELVFAGTIRQEMRAVLKPYEGLFRYLGPLARRELVRLYQDSSLLVLPSVQDGFGFVVTEAIACGLPAIVTDHVGARDVIEPGTNGYVVPVRSAEAIAETIRKVYASRELQRSLRRGAIASRAQVPNIASTARQIAAAYRRTYDGRRLEQAKQP